MLRGEHDKSDRHSSSALDRGMPSRAEYLLLIMASMPTFSHAHIWSLCAAGPSCTQLTHEGFGSARRAVHES